MNTYKHRPLHAFGPLHVDPAELLRQVLTGGTLCHLNKQVAHLV